MTSTDEASGWAATEENEGSVVEEVGEADGVAEGAKTRSAEEVAADVVATSTDVAAVVCSTVEVEYGTPSWSTYTTASATVSVT